MVVGQVTDIARHPRGDVLILWYTHGVRRSLSILLILFVGLPLISPLFALSPDVGSLLPACCRRHGAHHCASMMDQSQATALAQKHHLTAPWTAAPPTQGDQPIQHQVLSFNSSAILFAAVVSHPAMHQQTEAGARIALDGVRRARTHTTRLSELSLP